MHLHTLVPRPLRKSFAGRYFRKRLGYLTVEEVSEKHGIPLQTAEFFVRMAGVFPELAYFDLDGALKKRPDLIRNPFPLYLHIYDNGNPAARPAPKRHLFLHLQHTGGDTIERIMQANVRSIAFRRDYKNIPNLPPHFLLNYFRRLPPAQQETERAAWNRYDALAEHIIYGIHEMVSPPFGYFTILQDPVERLIDFCAWLDVQSSKGKEGPVRRKPVGEYLADPDFQKDFMLGKSYVQKLSGYPLVGNFLLRSRSRSVVERAKKKLSSFDLVLLAEAFDESVELLCKTYGWQDMVMEGARAAPRNGRTFDFASASDRSISEEERRAAEKFLREDIEIYELGKQIFEAARKRLPRPQPRRSEGRSKGGHLPAGRQAPTDLYRTRLGPIHISARWMQMARQQGVDPEAMEIDLRQTYYSRQIEGPRLIEYGEKKWKVHRDVPRMWLETNHAEHIATEVIEYDSYGLQALKDAGLMPKTILDVGGHIGTFSLLAHHIWPEARIVTVEPLEDDRIDPNNAKVLRLNVGGIPQVTVVNEALIGLIRVPPEGNRMLMEELAADENHEHWLELGLRGHPRYQKTIKRSGMRAISVAELLERTGLDRIDLLKMDCEGSETNVLRELSSLGMLPKVGKILGEWHGDVAKNHIPGLLAATHKVDMRFVPPLNKSGLFYATPRTPFPL